MFIDNIYLWKNIVFTASLITACMFSAACGDNAGTETCKFTINLIYDQTKESIPGLVRISLAEQSEPLELTSLVRRDNGWYAMIKPETVLDVQEPGWIALRIPSGASLNELGHPLFAHTSPIYIEVADRGSSFERKSPDS